MHAQTKKTTFSCKDDCILTKHTWRWTYSALRYFLYHIWQRIFEGISRVSQRYFKWDETCFRYVLKLIQGCFQCVLQVEWNNSPFMKFFHNCHRQFQFWSYLVPLVPFDPICCDMAQYHSLCSLKLFFMNHLELGIWVGKLVSTQALCLNDQAYNCLIHSSSCIIVMHHPSCFMHRIMHDPKKTTSKMKTS